MSAGAAGPPLPSPNGSNGNGAPQPLKPDDAELDAREAAFDAVIERIDVVLPIARQRVQAQQERPAPRPTLLRQLRRTRAAFLVLGQTAEELQAAAARAPDEGDEYDEHDESENNDGDEGGEDGE